MNKAVLAAVAVGGLLVVGAAAASTVLVNQPADPNGPLQSDSKTTVSYAVDTSTPVTWGLPMRNPAESPITLDSVEPIDVSGLTIISVGVSSVDPVSGAGSLVLQSGWPPDGVVLQDVRSPGGATMPVAGTGDPDLQFIFAVQRSASDRSGSIGGVRVVYEFQQRRYVADLPWVLELTVPGNSAAPSPT